MAIHLVVNADDLGYDPEIDRGILEAHARGLVTSATAMVDTPFAAGALRAAPASLGLGLHAVLDPGSSPGEAAASLRRQLDRFAALRGAPPTHLDGHKHAHLAPRIRDAVLEVAAEHRLAVRAIDAASRAAIRARGLFAVDLFLGDAARRPAWTPEALEEALRGLARAADGAGSGSPPTAELMAHPGHAPSHARTSFGAEREVELAALVSPGARAAAAASAVIFCTYVTVQAAARGG